MGSGGGAAYKGRQGIERERRGGGKKGLGGREHPCTAG